MEQGDTPYFQNVHVRKTKDRLQKYPTLEEAKEMWQLKATPNPRLDPVLEAGNAI